jgi:eukaryotic-like serine/threonine-protein kinase
MFGLRDEQQAKSGTRTGTDTVGRWVAATSGDAVFPADASGRLVNGRYRLIAELGVGGMGVTYRAWDTQAGIPVVVKMPRREVRSDSEAMQRFAREIAVMLAVSHDSIVPITDHGDDDGCPFVVMRFLPGGSLADYRRHDDAGSPIRNPPGMLNLWLPGVAAALDHIHAKGMLHRDVKPGNIFLDGFLKPYLGDFGIAKVVDESSGLQKEQTLTATKMAIGTPEYMAPELFKPQSKPNGSVDQYALAVTVYEMLCGEKPFKGDRAHIIVEHSAMPVPPLAAKVPGLPQSLYVAVEKGLAKSAEERFTTCSEFAEAVVAELAVLPRESDTVRLLCPGCKNILKLPQKAAGRTGRCPRCREAIDVAADLWSLWLESEERCGRRVVAASTAAPSQSLQKLDEPEPQPVASKATRRGMHWIAVVAAFVAGLLGGVTIIIGILAIPSPEPIISRGILTPKGVETLTNSIGMRFNLCRAGTFTMGDDSSNGDGQPEHHVTIAKPFYVGIYEVTNAEYRRVMGELPGRLRDDDRRGDDLPVECVFWEDATEFARKLSELPEERLARRKYRLPTEAEWEYACRAGTKTRYSFDFDEGEFGEFVWFGRNSGRQTHRVGEKKPNAWGLYDMYGNVEEWCSDWYGDYGSGVVTDPQGPASGYGRVSRGGNFLDSPVKCRSASRRESSPSSAMSGNGFRLALSLPEVQSPKAEAGK